MTDLVLGWLHATGPSVHRPYRVERQWGGNLLFLIYFAKPRPSWVHNFRGFQCDNYIPLAHGKHYEYISAYAFELFASAVFSQAKQHVSAMILGLRSVGQRKKKFATIPNLSKLCLHYPEPSVRHERLVGHRHGMRNGENQGLQGAQQTRKEKLTSSFFSVLA